MLFLEKIRHLHLPRVRLEAVFHIRIGKAGYCRNIYASEIAQSDIVSHACFQMFEKACSDTYVPGNVRRLELNDIRHSLVADVEAELRTGLGIQRQNRSEAETVAHVKRNFYRVEVFRTGGFAFAVAYLLIEPALAVLRRHVQAEAYEGHLDPQFGTHVPACALVGIEIFALVERKFRHIYAGHHAEIYLCGGCCNAAGDEQRRQRKE